MTLDALASNDGDCPECEVEIHLGEYLSEALDTNQRLEAELAATVKDSLTVWKAQMARDSAELRRLCAERDKLKAKAVVPGWMTTPEAFAERAYHAGWRDIADAQHEGIAVMYDELFASAPAQPQSDGVMDGLVDAVKDVLDHLNDGHSIHSGTGLHSCLQAAYRALLGGEA